MPLPDVRSACSPEFIPGIYNYCDRWCGRCAFSERCRVHAALREYGDDPDHPRGHVERTMEILKWSLEQASQELQRSAKARGLSLDALDATGDEERHRRATNAHPLTRAARDYTVLACEWFHAEGEALAAAIRTLRPGGRASEEELRTLLDLDDHLAVIAHDASLVAAKMSRAVAGVLLTSDREGQEDDAADEADDDVVQTDANGSAKVVLLSVDRSLRAWRAVAGFHPAGEETAGVLCGWLERLRRDVEQQFPHARAFRRPGFDGEGPTGGAAAAG
jgi:hypothetical protein